MAVQALCEKCGQTFTLFLEEMAAQNQKVVCPKCAAAKDCRTPVPAQKAVKH
jgi:formylmethanofuran dehydrogenase subunit E